MAMMLMMMEIGATISISSLGSAVNKQPVALASYLI
jgi:hypothetical protein